MEKENGLSTILISLLYFVLGVIFIAATDELLTTFNYILVSICAIIGILQIISFFLGKKYKNGTYDLLIGVVFIWVSLVLYVYYRIMINILPILFSLYLFIMAVDLIVKYTQYKEVTNVKRGKYLLLGFIAIIIGLLLIFNPGSAIYTYLKTTGIYLILVSLLYAYTYIKSFKKESKET